jgi:dCMP deaminase|tara:strand:- start:1755 stop:2213 length:459 start_codon:yes stop_codon:yes gene_type:complete
LKDKFIKAHLHVARVYGSLSTAERLKVGCIIVKDDRIISIGYNGMPSGASNVCEEDGKTKPAVIHAEANAITKLAKSTESGQDSYMFCTYAPCVNCAKLIMQSGIIKYYYEFDYKNDDGISLLNTYGKVEVHKYMKMNLSDWIQNDLLPYAN